MKIRNQIILITLFIILMFTNAFAEYPKAEGFVNDFDRVLSSSDKTRLEALCREISRKANIDISFVTMDVIPEGQDIALYATELGHAWGVGKKGSDRGALILYKTGKSDDLRQIYLATGYGLEGFIPDSKAGRIRDDILIPYLRQGRVFEAFSATAATITQIVEPEIELTGGVVPRNVRAKRQDEGPSTIGTIFMIVIFLLLMSNRTGRHILFGMMLGSMMGGGRRSSWGGGGSSFGGGFGGFGGGGFGGGGAGGSF
jgi:uncharacterized protein